ncbi:sulfotransferase 1C3-like isoform X2 [Amblyomma americanum]
MPENLSNVSKFYPEDSIRSALSYKPRPDDVFVVTDLPLCGGTWVQLIVYHILHEKAPPAPLLERARHLPHLEMQGAEALDAMPRPGSIRTHLPYRLVPRAECAKYIYVASNPYDCCAFFYQQMLNAQGKDASKETFEGFYDDFVEGRAMCGDYLDSLTSWYARRFDDNVLFLTYQELAEENKTTVLRIADFLDVDGEYGRKLRRSRRLLEKICAETRNEGVWECVESDTKRRMQEAAAISDEGKPEWVKRLQKAGNSEAYGKLFAKKAKGYQQGVIGDSMLTPEMAKRMQERIKAVAGAGCDVMNLWKSDD